MKVHELIEELQKVDPGLIIYISWTEMSDSGTAWDAGTEASYVYKEYGGEKPDYVVIR